MCAKSAHGLSSFYISALSMLRPQNPTFEHRYPRLSSGSAYPTDVISRASALETGLVDQWIAQLMQPFAHPVEPRSKWLPHRPNRTSARASRGWGPQQPSLGHVESGRLNVQVSLTGDKGRANEEAALRPKTTAFYQGEAVSNKSRPLSFLPGTWLSTGSSSQIGNTDLQSVHERFAITDLSHSLERCHHAPTLLANPTLFLS
jgi:hypothetical protein